MMFKSEHVRLIENNDIIDSNLCQKHFESIQEKRFIRRTQLHPCRQRATTVYLGDASYPVPVEHLKTQA